MIRCAGLGTVLVLVTLGVPGAEADLILFRDRDEFAAQGQIVFNYGFQDFPPEGARLPPQYYSDGITYLGSSNLVLGTGVPPWPIANVLSTTSNAVAAAGQIDTFPGTFDLFGLDLGYLYNFGFMRLRVSTNQGDYEFSNLMVPDARTALDFYGFRTTGPGEYFTGFSYISDNRETAHASTNFTLGTTSVPEPASWVLLAGGALGILGAVQRRRSRAV